MATYTVALTKSGQMTLPKELREFLGVEGARTVQLEKNRTGVSIRRKMSQEELFEFFDSNVSDNTRRIIAEDHRKGVKTVHQMREEIAKTPKEVRRLEEEYGSKTN